MILDRYEKEAYADDDWAFVHLNFDEFGLESTEKTETWNLKMNRKREQLDIEYVPQGTNGYIRILRTAFSGTDVILCLAEGIGETTACLSGTARRIVG